MGLIDVHSGTHCFLLGISRWRMYLSSAASISLSLSLSLSPSLPCRVHVQRLLLSLNGGVESSLVALSLGLTGNVAATFIREKRASERQARERRGEGWESGREGGKVGGRASRGKTLFDNNVIG